MSQCKDPRSCKSQLRGWSTMIFHTVIILTHINGGESLANSQHRMLAVIGHTQSIILPCSASPATDVVDEMVEWSRSDLNPRFVHVRRSGEDLMVDQNPSYKNRTSMSVDGLKMGDASLKLTKVRLSDEGTYRCFVPGLKTDFSVELVVEADIQITKVSPGVLECKSEGWYPEPEVFWLERERKLVSAGSKETLRGPDDLGTISSRLTLENGHSNNFTCRIQQNNLQREATIYVPDDFFVESSSSTRSVIGGLIAGIMFVSVVLFLVWKWRKNKMETKKSSDHGESQSGREDNRCSLSKDPEKEALMKNREECKGGSEAVMDQGTVEVRHPAHASKQPILSCENEHGVSNYPLPVTQSDRQQQHNDQPGRHSTNAMCSDEKTQSGNKTPALAKRETHPEPLDANIETPNQSPMDSSGQKQQPNEVDKVKNDTDKKENTKKIQTINNETAGESPSEDGKQKTHGKNIPEVQKKDRDGESPITTNTETADPLEKNGNQPIPTERKETEEENGPKSSTQPSHLEGNGINQGDSGSTELPKIEENQSGNLSANTEGSVDGDQQQKSNHATQPSHLGGNRINQEDSGSTVPPKTEENQSGNTSPNNDSSVGGDPHKHSTESINATSGQEDRNNGTNVVITQTTKNKTDESTDKDMSQNDDAVGEEKKKEQDDTEKGSEPNPATQPSHLGGNGTNQEPSNSTARANIDKKQSGNTEGSVDGDQQQKPNHATQPSHLGGNRINQEDSGSTVPPKTEENQSGNTSPNNDSSVGGDPHKHSTESTNATSGQENRNSGTNVVITQTTTNKTDESADKDMSQNDDAVGEKKKKEQDGTEKGSEPNPATQPSHLGGNGTNQEPSNSTAWANIDKKQSGNTSANDDGSVRGDPQKHSTESTNVTGGLGDQNNDSNGVITQTTENKTAESTDKEMNHSDPAVGGETDKGQDDTN